MKAPQALCFDVSDPGFSIAAAVEALGQEGCIILRNVYPQAILTEFRERLKLFMKRPAVSGAMGYSKYDYPKKLVSPFVVGGAGPMQLTLDETVIDVIETYMGSDCILADASVKYDEGVGYVYFPLHADFAVGWRKDPSMAQGLTQEEMKLPVGIGGVVYLEDSTEGAFSYCLGSHQLLAPHGQNLMDYPADMQQSIRSRLVRFDGKAGDLVLFDDRGFHAPDQPSRSNRTVILLDYYRVGTFGMLQVTPHPVWTSDIRGLSTKQTRVLGFGARYIVPPEQFSKTRFKRNWLYPAICWMIDHAYIIEHLQAKLKQRLQRPTI